VTVQHSVRAVALPRPRCNTTAYASGFAGCYCSPCVAEERRPFPSAVRYPTEAAIPVPSPACLSRHPRFKWLVSGHRTALPTATASSVFHHTSAKPLYHVPTPESDTTLPANFNRTESAALEHTQPFSCSTRLRKVRLRRESRDSRCGADKRLAMTYLLCVRSAGAGVKGQNVRSRTRRSSQIGQCGCIATLHAIRACAARRDGCEGFNSGSR
jgi:hypothetical protein